MVSFSCEACGDVLTKKASYPTNNAYSRQAADTILQKLDPHRSQCRGASFTCLDCMVHFQGSDYRSHTSCISEAQKYQGALYREKDNKKGGNKRKSMNGYSANDAQAMVPRNAYVEDAPEGDDSNTVAVVDVPPRAPTPPPAHEALPESVNVFDFLVSEATPNGTRRELKAPHGSNMVQTYAQQPNGESQYSQYSNGDGSQFHQHGFSYGYAPVQPTFERYDSWQNMTDAQPSQTLMPPPYVTPGPRHERSDRKDRTKSEKSDKKRKRQQVEELDLSSSKRPTSRGDDMMRDATSVGSGGRLLHTGLTGGLTRLVTDPEFYDDRIDAGPTPISPLKRSRHDKEIKDARRKSSYTSYSTAKSTTSKHSEDKHHRSRSKDRESTSDRHRQRKRRDSSSSPESRHRTSRKEYKAIDYPDRPTSVQPSATNQMISYRSKAEMFLSFVNKGPDSEKGCSMNKALKRYHRERDVRGDEKEEDDKDLWKSLRLRRNERGEIVVFF
ncbi:hypothetical protein B0A55_04527 [Friedmanniomyces simplex]|uniref:Zinc finger C2H2 LYAR-type domain-containing protein n=1 Tax=Friedmanniomyces simplex TaxID=329884 RepID=A0A4U0XCB7_9PEZI|nr:hypothetical protein B0A55_04527 [Friedmanniomyces simplex]